MREQLLFIVRVVSLLSVPVWISAGLKSLLGSHSSDGIGWLMLLAAPPVAIAHAIVFEYVEKRLREERMADNETDTMPPSDDLKCGDTKGTPWERNPKHTL